MCSALASLSSPWPSFRRRGRRFSFRLGALSRGFVEDVWFFLHSCLPPPPPCAMDFPKPGPVTSWCLSVVRTTFFFRPSFTDVLQADAVPSPVSPLGLIFSATSFSLYYSVPCQRSSPFARYGALGLWRGRTLTPSSMMRAPSLSSPFRFYR